MGEITVTADHSRIAAIIRRDGTIRLGSNAGADQPSFMGSGDVLGSLRSLPYVATTAELKASLSVRGAGAGNNLFEADGVRVVNPMHMLGFYSAFNPAFYRYYDFRADRMPATSGNATGAHIVATGVTEPARSLSGKLSAGLIESHGAITVPVGRSSITVGARGSYLGLLFPDILKLDKTTINYGFHDINASWAWRPDSSNRLNASVFYNRDILTLNNDKGGKKDMNFGWHNIAAGIAWSHKALSTSVGLSTYKNDFDLLEGGKELKLPSRLTQLTARGALPVGNFRFAADINYRYCSGQYNVKGQEILEDCGSKAIEGSLGGDWCIQVARRLNISTGLRLTAYHCRSYNTLMPMPRLAVTWAVNDASIYLSYTRLAQFDHLVEETTASFPADFWANSDSQLHPADTHAVELGLQGILESLGLGYLLEGYYRRMLNVVEFDGSLIDLANPGFNPAEHLTSGNGYSAGLSVALTRSYGRLRGRLSYNLGFARLRNRRYGPDRYAAPHDRRHDLTANLSYDITNTITVAATYTHASGTPYTRAKYGYMIGENLICEYMPHNSSRLPSYNRLDVSADWTFMHRGRCRHKLNLSVYNATAARNILFVYTSYSIDTGIRNRQSIMKSVIPSLSYAIEF